MTVFWRVALTSACMMVNFSGATSVFAADAPRVSGWSAKIETDKQAFTQTGVASFYSASGPTASGLKVDPGIMTAAHRSLPFGSRVKVKHLKTGREVEVVVTDRGPFLKGRILDVSPRAAKELGMVDQGVARVRLTVVD
jgi:rare lipoprotein A